MLQQRVIFEADGATVRLLENGDEAAVGIIQ